VKSAGKGKLPFVGSEALAAPLLLIVLMLGCGGPGEFLVFSPGPFNTCALFSAPWVKRPGLLPGFSFCTARLAEGMSWREGLLWFAYLPSYWI